MLKGGIGPGFAVSLGKFFPKILNSKENRIWVGGEVFTVEDDGIIFAAFLNLIIFPDIACLTSPVTIF